MEALLYPYRLPLFSSHHFSLTPNMAWALRTRLLRGHPERVPHLSHFPNPGNISFYKRISVAKAHAAHSGRKPAMLTRTVH